MNNILIECSPGISGDMLLAALFDLGVPQDVIEKPLVKIGLKKSYSLCFSASKSKSIRGVRAQVKILENNVKRDWKTIKKLILDANLEKNLEKKIIKVFQSLATAEGKVHGINPENVHFHEIGSIDSLVDIIGICSALDYLKPRKIFSNSPELGNGYAQTEHGKISIPSPAVIELISKNNITVSRDFNSGDGELSTPTGIAIISNLVDNSEFPSKYKILSYGVGIGSRSLPYPNLTRVLTISSPKNFRIIDNQSPIYEEITIQEAWIDDQSSEDLISFVEILRSSGAYDISYKAINMKKDRIGYSVTVILPIQKEKHFRDLWFNYSSTIGIRERRQGRWILPRRKGECITSFGRLRFKQTIKPNGEIFTKLENDEILKLQRKYQKSAYEIREIIKESMGEFKAFEDWE